MEGIRLESGLRSLSNVNLCDFTSDVSFRLSAIIRFHLNYNCFNDLSLTPAHETRSSLFLLFECQSSFEFNLLDTCYLTNWFFSLSIGFDWKRSMFEMEWPRFKIKLLGFSWYTIQPFLKYLCIMSPFCFPLPFGK